MWPSGRMGIDIGRDWEIYRGYDVLIDWRISYSYTWGVALFKYIPAFETKELETEDICGALGFD